MDAKLLSVTILKKLRDLKLIPDFADEVNEIIWRLEDLFFVKKKRHINPGMTEAGKYILDDNRPNYICLKIYSQYQHIEVNVFVNKWFGFPPKPYST